MGVGFRKFKRRAVAKGLLKSAVCGLSFGLFALGATLLTCKLLGAELPLWLYIAVCVGAAALFGGLLYLAFKPADKKLATELDKRFALNEKVQTAVAYSLESGTIVEMHRDDTDSRLVALSKSKAYRPTFKQFLSNNWQFFVIVLLAAAIVLTGLLMPWRNALGAEEEPDRETPFILSDLQITEVEELIENIEASELNGSVKAAAVKSVNQLLGNLSLVDTESEMNVWVNATLKKLRGQFTEAYVYQKLANSLATVGQRELALILASGAQIYLSYPLTTYESVGAFAEESAEKIQEEIGDPIEEFFAALKEDMGVVPAQIFIAAVTAKVAADEPLYQILYDLPTALVAWEEGESSPQAKFLYELSDALAEQAYIHAMYRYITFTIADVFGVPLPLEAQFVPSGAGSSGGEEDDDKKGNTGGYGDGSLQGGSDDMIYNPNTGEYEKYLDILNEYFAIVDAMLREGNLTEEQIAVIRSYFDILYSGF